MTATAAAPPVRIGPADAGRRMSLAEFDLAEGQGGYLYELGRGEIVVMNVPNPAHLAQQQAIRDQLVLFKAARPGRIHTVAEGGGCKILITESESERHPDLAVYVTPPPAGGSEVWGLWVPSLVVEVVSAGSERRDYEEKRDEYFRFGVAEYWIVDHAKRELTFLRRFRGRWTEGTVRPPEPARTPHLPGFALDLSAVFAAADAAPPETPQTP
jgi:Uma2 family endonuclease